MTLKKYGFLFVIFSFAGILLGSLFRGSYYDDLKNVMDNYMNYVINSTLYIKDSENAFLIVRIITNRVVEFALLWLLSVTSLRQPFCIWLVVKYSFIWGLFSFFMFTAYGFHGFSFIGAWLFPHCLLYIFVYAASIIIISNSLPVKRRVLIPFLTLLLLAGCFLEAFVNPAILSTAFQQYF